VGKRREVQKEGILEGPKGEELESAKKKERDRNRIHYSLWKSGGSKNKIPFSVKGKEKKKKGNAKGPIRRYYSLKGTDHLSYPSNKVEVRRSVTFNLSDNISSESS